MCHLCKHVCGHVPEELSHGARSSDCEMTSGMKAWYSVQNHGLEDELCVACEETAYVHVPVYAAVPV